MSLSSDSPSCGFNGSNLGECLTLTSDLSWALARSRLRSCWGINLGGWCERQSTYYGHQAPWIVKFHEDSAQTCSNHCSRCFLDSLLFSYWGLSISPLALDIMTEQSKPNWLRATFDSSSNAGNASAQCIKLVCSRARAALDVKFISTIFWVRFLISLSPFSL